MPETALHNSGTVEASTCDLQVNNCDEPGDQENQRVHEEEVCPFEITITLIPFLI